MGFRLTENSRPDGGGILNPDMSGPAQRRADPAKRAFDIFVSATALIILSPIMLVFAILVYFQDRASPLFAQDRYGLNGETFRCYKLRSMVVDASDRLKELLENNPEARKEWNETQKLQDDPRITKFGAFIRKMSIDELPQLFNVLRGDMSLVGPRPIVQNEISRYGNDFQYYKAVRPGLTGLWQVKGRSNTTYDERVAMDVEYVQTRTFWGDFWIVVMTIPAVIASRGAV